MTLIRTWAPFFRSNIRMRGRAYQMAGRVAQQAPQPGEIVRAEVRGSRVYLVTIRGEGSAAVAHCTCPVFASGLYCKHIWATLLDLQERGPALPTGTDAETAAAVSPQPKARKRGATRLREHRSEPQWVGRLSMVRPTLPALEAAVPPLAVVQRQLCYVVVLDLCLRHQNLVIDVRQRQATRNGWGPLRPLRIAAGDLSALPDPLDREFCAQLLGAEPLDGELERPAGNGRHHSAFNLLRGSWRSTLQKLTATGRCFLDLGEQNDGLFRSTAPGSGAGGVIRLGWDGDEPWALWLVGLDDGQGLSVNLELRRGQATMSLGRPVLLLGGLDGIAIYDRLAAGFDDRGGSRWVTQFRDDLNKAEGEVPIRVPAPDITRFLDRLYLLPNLPEIELPPGIGRPEQHVEPVPHLELFNPSLDAPADPAMVKSLLLARVWFAYGDQAVKPGQAGRFLSLAAEQTGDARIPVPDERADASTASVDSGPAEAPFALLDDEEGETAGDESANEADTPPATEGQTEAAAAPDPASRLPALIRRDIAREQQALTLLVDLGVRPSGGDTIDPGIYGYLPVRMMSAVVEQLLARGWVVTADRKIVRRAAPPAFSVRSGVDWFELRGSVRYGLDAGPAGNADSAGDQTVSLPEILAAARAGRSMVTLGDGSQGLLPQQWLAEHGLLTNMGQVEGDHLRFRKSQSALLDTLLRNQELVDVDAQFAAARQRLARFTGITPRDPGSTFHGTLRPYQRDGLGWLAFLRWFGIGGILADDMGLGKTIQVLAMLDARYHGGEGAAEMDEAEGSAGPPDAGGKGKLAPTLIVVPRSVVYNWVDEATRFTPQLRVQSYTGTDRQALRQAFVEHDVIVTSYGLMRRDVAELRHHQFDYLILDEAQGIKNPASQVARAVRLLRAQHRLALSGTPVENHLGDLWSIFEFLNPGMLGSSAAFAQLVRGAPGTPGNPGSPAGGSGNGHETNEDRGPGESATEEGSITNRASTLAAGLPPGPTLRPGRIGINPQAAAQLAQALRPFVLRRTKKQVLTELPEKTEQTIVCEMEPAQREIYEQLLRHYRGSLLKQVDSKGLSRSTLMVLEALLRLRQAACHPGLIDAKLADGPSAKLDELLERLTDLIEEGHKALVFSQFTSMLALVRKQLDARGMVYEYLDGQTRHRGRHVQRFQTDPACPLFLISLKAGGLGLNLTAAEYVFILDPWWNPAVENQAIDRAHRIGQDRHVFAYRMICQNTVEERIAELQQKKKHLAEAIIGGQENLLRTLTRDDLDRLLS